MVVEEQVDITLQQLLQQPQELQVEVAVEVVLVPLVVLVVQVL